MKSKALFWIVSCAIGIAVVSTEVARAQRGEDAQGQRGGGGGGQRGGGGGGQPAAEREYSITGIPGVIAAGAKWKLVWGGNNNADGLAGTPDGGLLFAQEQPNRISKL